MEILWKKKMRIKEVDWCLTHPRDNSRSAGSKPMINRERERVWQTGSPKNHLLCSFVSLYLFPEKSEQGGCLSVYPFGTPRCVPENLIEFHIFDKLFPWRNPFLLLLLNGLSVFVSSFFKFFVGQPDKTAPPLMTH